MHRNNETRDLILKLAGTTAGFSVGDYKGPLSAKAVSQWVYKLRDAGLLFVGSRGHKTVRYFTAPDAALKWGRLTAPPVTVRAKATRAEFKPADAPVNTVKVTICPSFDPDLRWAPSGPFERVITGDWMLRRQQEAAAP